MYYNEAHEGMWESISSLNLYFYRHLDEITKTAASE